MRDITVDDVRNHGEVVTDSCYARPIWGNSDGEQAVYTREVLFADGYYWHEHVTSAEHLALRAQHEDSPTPIQPELF